MQQTRQISAALLMMALLAGPAAAEDGSGGPGDHPGGGFDGAPGRELAGESAYDDIMDDVNAVIDVMDRTKDEDEAEMAPEAAPAASMADFVDTGRESPFAFESSAKAVPDFSADAAAPAANAALAPAPRAQGRAGPNVPSPVVVELFTAQGCTACLPADDMLADLAGRRDVLALSWHVDYWDYLGWPDSFARPEFSRRQKGYNLARGTRMLFTPQFIIGGETAIDQPQPAQLMAAINRELAEGNHLTISRKDDGPRLTIELTPRGPLPAPIVVELVRYLPHRSIEVEAGENHGRRLQQRNVVAASEVLAKWDGKGPLRLTVTLGAGPAGTLPADTKHALLVQHVNGSHPGEIFAALVLD